MRILPNDAWLVTGVAAIAMVFLTGGFTRLGKRPVVLQILVMLCSDDHYRYRKMTVHVTSKRIFVHVLTYK